MCRPAGAILHPLGRSVAPRSRPGRSTIVLGCAAAGEIAAANSEKTHVQPGAQKIFTCARLQRELPLPCGRGRGEGLISTGGYEAGSPISVKSGVRRTPGCSCFLNQDPRGLTGVPGCGVCEEMIRRGCVRSFSSGRVASGCQAVPVELAACCMVSPPITLPVLQDPFPPQVAQGEKLACGAARRVGGK